MANQAEGPYFHEKTQQYLVIVEVAICFAMPVRRPTLPSEKFLQCSGRAGC